MRKSDLEYVINAFTSPCIQRQMNFFVTKRAQTCFAELKSCWFCIWCRFSSDRTMDRTASYSFWVSSFPYSKICTQCWVVAINKETNKKHHWKAMAGTTAKGRNDSSSWKLHFVLTRERETLISLTDWIPQWLPSSLAASSGLCWSWRMMEEISLASLFFNIQKFQFFFKHQALGICNQHSTAQHQGNLREHMLVFITCIFCSSARTPWEVSNSKC